MSHVLAFSLAASCLIIAVIAAALTRKHRLVFLLAGVWEALFLLLLPLYQEQGSPGMVQHVFLTAYHSLQILGANGEYFGSARSLRALGAFGRVYSVTLTVLYAAGPVLTLSFLLSFIRAVSARFRWIFSRGRETWFFSEPSRKALRLAQDIRARDGHVRVVFCRAEGENYAPAKALGIPFAFALNDCPDWFFTRCPASVFFAGEDEDANFSEALAFIEKYRDTLDRVMLYPLARGKEKALILENRLKGAPGMLGRLLDEERALAWRVLQALGAEEGCLNKPRPEDGRKHLRFLLVGRDELITQLTEALLWGCVDVDTDITLEIAGPDGEAFFRSHPGLKEQDDLGKYAYTLHFMSEGTFDAQALVRGLEDPEGIDCAFVSLGSDGKNASGALALRRALEGEFLKTHGRLPLWEERVPIRAAVTEESLVDFGEDWHILPLTKDGERDCVDTLLAPDLEIKAGQMHLRYRVAAASAEERPQAQADLAGYQNIRNIREMTKYAFRHPGMAGFYTEYGGTATRARALSGTLHAPWPQETQQEMEHIRWSMFMLSSSWRPDPTGQVAGRADMAGIHGDLVPYEALSPQEKEKDG